MYEQGTFEGPDTFVLGANISFRPRCPAPRASQTLLSTLDLMYTYTESSHSSLQLPPLGNSDHNVIELVPEYQSRHTCMSAPPKQITEKCWNDEESVEKLKYKLDTTDWSVLITEDLD